MKKIILIATIVVCKTYAAADTLRVNIGAKSSVIFYATTPADFKEIEKYDLNRLFKEVKQRSERNFNLNEEISLKEVDKDLKNLDNNKNLFAKNKNWYWNMFVGMGVTVADNEIVYFSDNIQDPVLGGEIQITESIAFINKPSINFGIGIFKNHALIKKTKSKIDLKYGLGMDIFNTYKGANIFNRSGLYATNIRHAFADSIFRISQSTSLFNSKLDTSYKKRNLISPTINVQFIPTFYKIDKKGNNSFSLGFGIKSSLVLKTNFENFRNGEDVPLPFVKYKYNRLTNAWVVNLGFKQINTFIEVTPNVGISMLYSNKQSPLSRNRVGYSNITGGIKFGR